MTKIAALSALGVLMAACAPTTNPPPAVPLPPAPPSGEPATFIGLSADNLRADFGNPAFVRTENGAQMWRYDSSSCRAFFFLYPSGPAIVVRHVETIPEGKDTAADPKCLDALRAPSTGRPAS